MATASQTHTISRYVQEGVKKIGGEKDPMRARSIVDSYVVDCLRKNHPPEFQASLGSMDIQECLDDNPDVPNVPKQQQTGAPGVVVVSEKNFVTSAELARQMEANNEKLLAAMSKIVAEQNAKTAPAETENKQ